MGAVEQGGGPTQHLKCSFICSNTGYSISLRTSCLDPNCLVSAEGTEDSCAGSWGQRDTSDGRTGLQQGIS